ncbi:MAG TPA: DUF4199 domain-containing protein, partial [Flavobacterium sp.]
MSKFSIEFKWAIIFVLCSLLWMVFEKSMGWHDELIDIQPIYTNLFAIIAIAIFVIALKDKKENFFNGNMTWTQGFLSGVILTIIITLLSPLSQYITHTYITPNYFRNAINHTDNHNVYSREQAEAFFNLKSYIIQACLAGLSMGVVTSAIVSLFVR